MSSVSEVWRPVVGHETTHEVSNLGRVKSLARVVPCGRGSMKRLEKVSCGSRSKSNGYITRKIKGERYLVHRLVLEAFVGPCPPHHQACHCNGKRDDNRSENLRWDTPKANQADRIAHGTTCPGERCGMSKLTDSQVIEIMHSKDPHCVLAVRHGVNESTIASIRKGKTWKHLGITPRADYEKGDSLATKRRLGKLGQGEQIHSAKLTESQVQEIRRTDGSYADLSRRYGVSSATVRDVVLGKTWKHLQEAVT